MASAPTFTTTELAEILGLTGERVRQLVKEGVIQRGRGNRFALAAITAYIAFLRESQRMRTNHTDLLEAEKFRKAKRENDLAEGLVAPVDVLEHALERAVAVLIPILEGIPLNLKRAWPEITGDQIQTVKQAIAEGRNALAGAEIQLDE